MSNNLKFSFTASLPPIQSAILLDGIDGAARIKLDIPSTELRSIIKLQILTGQIFKVTIEALDDNTKSKKVKFVK